MSLIKAFAAVVKITGFYLIGMVFILLVTGCAMDGSSAGSNSGPASTGNSVESVNKDPDATKFKLAGATKSEIEQHLKDTFTFTPFKSTPLLTYSNITSKINSDQLTSVSRLNTNDMEGVYVPKGKSFIRLGFKNRDEKSFEILNTFLTIYFNESQIQMINKHIKSEFVARDNSKDPGNYTAKFLKVDNLYLMFDIYGSIYENSFTVILTDVPSFPYEEDNYIK